MSQEETFAALRRYLVAGRRDARFDLERPGILFEDGGREVYISDAQCLILCGEMEREERESAQRMEGFLKGAEPSESP